MTDFISRYAAHVGYLYLYIEDFSIRASALKTAMTQDLQKGSSR